MQVSLNDEKLVRNPDEKKPKEIPKGIKQNFFHEVITNLELELKF